jgi:hypothetical protein
MARALARLNELSRWRHEVKALTRHDFVELSTLAITVHS